MITSAQCVTARAVLLWTQEDLAREARVSEQSVKHFETKIDVRGYRPEIERRIVAAFQKAGLVFYAEHEAAPLVLLRARQSSKIDEQN